MTEASETENSARIDYAARRRERASARAHESQGRWWLLGLAAVAALIVILVTVEVATSVGRIHPGVTVAGVKVGGMSPHAATTAVERELTRRASAPVRITEGKKHWTITSAQVGLSFDAGSAVTAAMAVGRDEAILAAVGGRIRAWTGGIDVPAAGTMDPAMLDVALDSVADDTDVAPVDATVKVADGTPEVVAGSDGRALDRALAGQLLLETFASKGKHEFEAPVEVAKVKVTDADAQEAAEVATGMLSSPVTVTYEKKSWEFAPEKIGGWLAFRPQESAATTPGSAADSTLEVYVDPKRAAKPVTSALGSGIGREAKDATFKTDDGRVTIIPSQDGIGPDVESLSLSLTEELKDQAADRVVELRTTRTEPKRTTSDAKRMGIRERISSYTTTYESGNRPRVTNIHLLGDALNGTLIPPGGTFSFNEAAGERTAEKGYQEANAIVNGKLVPQLGGGVCQVGTTVFNSVFMSGLPVIERKNHSFYISHYPTGRDATVSWGGPDLKFKNDTKKWVLVSVSYTSSSITVALYGTDPGYEVSAKQGEWSNVRPFPTENVKDSTIDEGTKVIEDLGITGRTMTVERTVTKDGKVVRTDTFVSVYKPKAQVVRVGTKKTTEKPASSKP